MYIVPLPCLCCIPFLALACTNVDYSQTKASTVNGEKDNVLSQAPSGELVV